MTRHPSALMWTPPGLQLVRLLQGLMIALFLGSMVMAGWIWKEGQRLQGEIARYQKATALVNRTTETFVEDTRQAGLDLHQVNVQHLRKEVSFANQLLQTHTFSWTQFLKNLEETVPEGISLDAVRRQPAGSSITVTGHGASLMDVSRFVTALEEAPSFSRITLTNHRLERPSTNQAGERPETVSFTLTMDYQHRAPSPRG